MRPAEFRRQVWIVLLGERAQPPCFPGWPKKSPAQRTGKLTRAPAFDPKIYLPWVVYYPISQSGDTTRNSLAPLLKCYLSHAKLSLRPAPPALSVVALRNGTLFDWQPLPGCLKNHSDRAKLPRTHPPRTGKRPDDHNVSPRGEICHKKCAGQGLSFSVQILARIGEEHAAGVPNPFCSALTLTPSRNQIHFVAGCGN